MIGVPDINIDTTGTVLKYEYGYADLIIYYGLSYLEGIY